MSLSAVTETIEAEDSDAAELHVLLDDIVKGCEVIVSATQKTAA